MNEVTNEKELIDFTVALAKSESNCLGFIPRTTYESALLRGRMMYVVEGDELCGFAFWGRSQKPMNDSVSIYQLAVCRDARRLQHGMELLRAIANEPHALSRKLYRLNCRQNLEANEFWTHIGAVHVGTKPGRAKRGWLVNEYVGLLRPSEHLYTGIPNAIDSQLLNELQ